MPFVEIRQSGPDIPDGAYPVILSQIKGDPENPNQPRHVVPEQGPNAGKDLYFWDWVFAINVPGGHPLDGTEIEYGTSTSTGPRSKMYGLLTALLGGARPAVGMTFEKNQLEGRQALATIQRDEAGYCRITNLSALPMQASAQPVAAAVGAPVPPAAPVAAQPVAPVAPAAAGLPIQQIVPPQPAPGQFVAAPPTPAPLRDQVVVRDDLPF